MVNLRYHLVSLVAVFLALAIGILMGSTVVEQGTVSFLENRLDDVDDRASRTAEANQRLSDEIAALRQRARTLDAEDPGRLIADVAAGARVVVVVPQGDDDGIGTLRVDLATAGAEVVATVTLSRRLGTDEPAEIVRDLGLAPSLADDPAAVGAAAASVIAGGLRPDLVPDVLVQDDDRAAASLEILQALIAAGVLDVNTNDPAGLAGLFPVAGVAPVIVMAHPSDSPVPIDEVLVPLLELLGRDRAVAGVVVAVPPADAVLDALVAAVRGDETLAGEWSTIDDPGSFAARVALAHAVADVVAERPNGHYGTRDGAARVLPAPVALTAP